MKIVKLLLIAIISLIGIFFLIYFLSPKKPTKYKVKILILNNNYLNIDTIANRITERLSEKLTQLKPNRINFTFYNNSKILKPNFELSLNSGENLENFKSRIKLFLLQSLKDTILVSLENKKVNELFMNFLTEALTNRKEHQNTIYIIAGTFPDCYDNHSKSTLINSIK